MLNQQRLARNYKPKLFSYGEELQILNSVSSFFQRKNNEKHLGILVERQGSQTSEVFSRQKESEKVG